MATWPRWMRRDETSVLPVARKLQGFSHGLTQRLWLSGLPPNNISQAVCGWGRYAPDLNRLRSSGAELLSGASFSGICIYLKDHRLPPLSVSVGLSDVDPDAFTLLAL